MRLSVPRVEQVSPRPYCGGTVVSRDNEPVSKPVPRIAAIAGVAGTGVTQTGLSTPGPDPRISDPEACRIVKTTESRPAEACSSQ